MMKILKSTFFILSIISMFVLTVPAQAQTVKEYQYTVLSPLPGTTQGVCANAGDPGCKTDLKTYIEGLFKLLMGVSIAFVVINFVIGGFQYIVSPAMPGKKDGKDRIMNSLKGLALVTGAWLILNEINPELLTIKLTIEPVKTTQTIYEAGVLAAPGGACVGCEQIAGLSGEVELRSGANPNINSTTLERLKELDANFDGKFDITEGYNSREANAGGHQNDCHRRGDCMDIVLDSQTPSNINKFIDASNKSGLTARFEVDSNDKMNRITDDVCKGNQTCVNSLRQNICVYPPKDGKPQITGPHFSVYTTNPPACIHN